MTHSDSKNPADPKTQAPADIQARLMHLIASGGQERTWSVTELAHALDSAQWQDMVQPARNGVKALAHSGALVLYRKGKPADPATIKGVYRVGLPRHD